MGWASDAWDDVVDVAYGGVKEVVSGFGLFDGITDPLWEYTDPLINGPKSLGDPVSAPDPNAVAEQEAEDMAVRADIIRRNQLKRSSTAGTGADFIKKMRSPQSGHSKKSSGFGSTTMHSDSSLGMTEW